MSEDTGGMSLADTRRQVLALSATVGIVLIAIVVIAVYGMYRLDSAVSATQTELDRLTTLADDARIAQVTFKTQIQEWKNTLLRGYKAEDYAAYHSAFLTRRAEVHKRLDDLETAAKELDFPTADLAALQTHHDDLDAAYDEALKLFRAEDPLSIRAVDQYVRGKDRPLNEAFDKVVAQAQAFADDRRNLLHQRIAEVSRSVQRTLWISLAIGFAFLFLAVFMAMRAIRK